MYILINRLIRNFYSFIISSAYKIIGEVVKLVNSDNPKEIKINTNTIRFWETQFIELKPKIINNRRYYDSATIEKLKYIKFLLKSEGMTIQGVKKHLKQNDKHGFKTILFKLLSF